MCVWCGTCATVQLLIITIVAVVKGITFIAVRETLSKYISRAPELSFPTWICIVVLNTQHGDNSKGFIKAIPTNILTRTEDKGTVADTRPASAVEDEVHEGLVCIKYHSPVVAVISCWVGSTFRVGHIVMETRPIYRVNT